MRRCLCVLLIVAVAALVGCLEPATQEAPSSFKNLCQEKEKFFQNFQSREYTDGVVIYLSRESNDYLVATYLPLPAKDDLSDDQFIVVKGPITDLTVGDIIKVNGVVKKASGGDKGKVVVYYLDTGVEGWVVRTSRIDTEDPDFEELVRIVQRRVQDDQFRFCWLIWWLLIPTSPLSPIDMFDK